MAEIEYGRGIPDLLFCLTLIFGSLVGFQLLCDAGYILEWHNLNGNSPGSRAQLHLSSWVPKPWGCAVQSPLAFPPADALTFGLQIKQWFDFSRRANRPRPADQPWSLPLSVEKWAWFFSEQEGSCFVTPWIRAVWQRRAFPESFSREHVHICCPWCWSQYRLCVNLLRMCQTSDPFQDIGPVP